MAITSMSYVFPDLPRIGSANRLKPFIFRGCGPIVGTAAEVPLDSGIPTIFAGIELEALDRCGLSPKPFNVVDIGLGRICILFSSILVDETTHHTSCASLPSMPSLFFLPKQRQPIIAFAMGAAQIAV